MGLLLLFLFTALIISFLCSVLEAVLLSTPMSFITMKEQEGSKTAQLLKKYKLENEKPLAAILSLNTIAHTIGAAGVGAQSDKVFGNEYFVRQSLRQRILCSNLGLAHLAHPGIVRDYSQNHRCQLLAAVSHPHDTHHTRIGDPHLSTGNHVGFYHPPRLATCPAHLRQP